MLVSIIDFSSGGNGYRKHWKDIFNKNIVFIPYDVDIEMKWYFFTDTSLDTMLTFLIVLIIQKD